MRALLIITRSYLSQNIGQIMGMLVGIFFSIRSNFMLLSPVELTMAEKERYGVYLLLAMVLVVAHSTLHLRSLMAGSSSVLLPHFRRNHLIVYALLLSVFLIFPVFVTASNGFPMLQTLAMYLGVLALILWSTFLFGDQIIAIALLGWLGKSLHELLGFKSGYLIFDLPEGGLALLGSQVLFPILVIFAAVVSLIFFVPYFLRKATAMDAVNRGFYYGPYSELYDRQDKPTMRLTAFKMKSLLKKMGEKKKSSVLSEALFFQPVLFSPGFAFALQTFFFIGGLLVFFISLVFIVNEGALLKTPKYYLWPVIFFITSAMSATDFLQHRSRLPVLWMQTRLKSREAFARSVFITYLLVNVKGFLVCTLLLAASPFVFSTVHFINLLPVMAVGLGIYLVMPAMSLMFSDHIRTPNCKGWYLSIFFGAFPLILILLGIFNKVESRDAMWSIIGIFVLLSLLFLIGRYREWLQTEMDFAAVEQIG
ncbi:MAG: hypothetical protein GY765_41395 [bacterium]|nr:hypothetical protein [bacterium]